MDAEKLGSGSGRQHERANLGASLRPLGLLRCAPGATSALVVETQGAETVRIALGAIATLWLVVGGFSWSLLRCGSRKPPGNEF